MKDHELREKVASLTKEIESLQKFRSSIWHNFERCTKCDKEVLKGTLVENGEEYINKYQYSGIPLGSVRLLKHKVCPDCIAKDLERCKYAKQALANKKKVGEK